MKVNQLKLGVSEISGSIYLGIPKNLVIKITFEYFLHDN